MDFRKIGLRGWISLAVLPLCLWALHLDGCEWFFGLKWTPGKFFLAQSAHTAWAAFLTLFFSLVFRPSRVLLVELLIVLAKEYVFDIEVEGSTYLLETFDVGFYVLGAGLGLLARKLILQSCLHESFSGAGSSDASSRCSGSE